MLIRYPHDFPSLTISMISHFPTKDTVHSIRSTNRNAHGLISIYKASSWANYRIRSYTCELTEDQKDTLVSLLWSQPGDRVQVVDHENNLYTGVILNPETPIVEVSPFTYEVTLEIVKVA